MNPVYLEIARILLRYVAASLMLVGLPPELVDPLGDPAMINLAAGGLAFLLAEGGWLASKRGAK